MNRVHPYRRFLAVVATAGLCASPSWAGDFMDTRLTFVLSENNFFAGPGESRVNSPGFGIGADKSSTLFFDNYETRFSGFETLTHLVLYKKLPGFIEHLTTEASLVVRMRILDEKTTEIYDSGSFIRLAYDLSRGVSEDQSLELVLFPVSGDRFRAGYSYKISWGGSSIFPGNQGLVPAAKVQLNLPWGYGFLGFKTSQISEYLGDTNQIEMVTNYGVLGGFGIDTSGVRAEINGGFFTRGVFPHEGIRGEPLYGGGISYQVGYHQGMEIGTSIDFALYRNDPEMEVNFFRPEEYGEGLSLVAKHEGSFLFHTLEDPDSYGTTVNQLAYAFDLNFALKWGYWRVHLDAMYRTLSFLLYDVPGFTPFQDFPASGTTKGEFFLALGFDYHFPALRLTPGLKVGILQPASFTNQGGIEVGGVLFEGNRTMVVRDMGDRSVLPVDEEAMLIFSLKANLRWDISEALAMVVELYYSRDDNLTRYVSASGGMNVATEWDEPHILGMNLVAQARF